MNPISTVITWWLKRRMGEIDHIRNNPVETQAILWQKLIETARDTEWGRQYQYHKIRSIREFQERVPTSSYEELFPWIEKAMRGGENLLWPGITTSFSKSSGTTNDKHKYIPVTLDSLEECHYKGGKDLISLYLNNRENSEVLNGKNLAMGGSLQPNPLQSSAICGDISAVIMHNLPAWAQWMRTPSLEIALMDKWEEKIERMVATTLEENVTSISGVPTWMMVLMNRILEKTGASSISDIWPNLEVFLHGAVSFTPYREVFKKLIPNPAMSYLETYNASEGFFGIQDDLSLEGQMLLMLDYGIFYEFVPMEQAHDPFPQALTLDEVEIGKNYAVVISTNGGLWRYRIGDTIRFTSLYPFRIQVSGRTKHFINAFGEEVMIDNAELALARACEKSGAEVVDFTVAPEYMQAGKQGRHEWLIEFSKLPDSEQIFVETLDSELRKINGDYDAKRYKDMALLLPRIRVAPVQHFYNWLKSKGKLGGQHKVPRLSNSREYIEPMLAMIQSER
ncbi:MAG TPA: GH3 auxin-responsive promoter family protein [Catalimonadaceae bacterium]|nr:GH3 auxin-responsive promoter family protein [Catalimonadaceae bacterium]HPI09631.1 GH3 auxin-responsive promoter family protein [Catalimonadaceae bacterium]